MAVTIKDVAKQAGVSISTVSRVLNGTKPVRPEIKEKVLRVVKDTGYSPNPMARGLISKETGLVGVIVPELSNVVISGYLDGVSQVADVYPYHVLISKSDGVLENEIRYLNIMHKRQIEGIIFSCHQVTEAHYRQLKQMDIPCVIVGKKSTWEDIPSVHIDNVEAAFEATRYLVRNGHKQIGMIRGAVGDETGGDNRFEGFQAALRQEGIPLNEQWVVAAPFTIDGGYNAMKEILARGKDIPTAIFAASDRMAIGAMNGLFDAGLRVPEDVSIIGFDDIEAASVVKPRLTTIHYSFTDIGMTAMRLLAKMMNGEKGQWRHMNLPHRLVVRDSVKTMV